MKRDKAFFFFSYAGLRQTVGQFLSGGVVPTALERQGDFTQSKVIPNYPGTKTKVGGTNSSPNCQVPTVGCVPSGLLDPTAANIISKYIPLPNSANNAWTGFFTGPTNQDEYLGKYDQVLGDKDHLAATYFYLKSTQNANGCVDAQPDLGYQSVLLDAAEREYQRRSHLQPVDSQRGLAWLYESGGRTRQPAGSFSRRSRIEFHHPGTQRRCPS